MKSMLYMNFDKADTRAEKENLRKTMEAQGMNMIHEIQNDKKEVVEWIFMGAIQLGTFAVTPPPKTALDANKIYEFNPKGETQ